MSYEDTHLSNPLQCFLVLSACALPWLVLPVEAAPRVETKAAPDFAQIDRYVNAQVQDARIPGLALGIVRGDRVAHLHGFGEADSTGRAVTPHTPFLLGSTTKSFTVLAMMQLVEAGKITLDVPVQRYLPWFRVADPVASGHITVRHLLGSSGDHSRDKRGLPGGKAHSRG